MDTMVLTAVYVNVTDPLTEEPLIALFPSVTVISDSKAMLMFANSDTIPSGCTLIESGILLMKGSYSGELTINTSGVLITKVKPTSTKQFYIRKNNITSGETWYIRAYMIYKDASGNTSIVYSTNIQSVTIS
jgi:hypothetical protein